MKQRKKRWLSLVLLCTISLYLISGCSAIFQLKPAPIPAGANPKALAFDKEAEEAQALMQNMAKVAGGGALFSMDGTYEERLLNAYNSFHIKPSSPFTAQIMLSNYEPAAQEFVIICLLDHA